MTTQLTSTRQATTPAVAVSSRRLDIQGLRAIAVLLVIAFHAQLPVPGGFVGVDVFFVISGFVITAMLMREWRTHGRLRFGHFYLRRFLRLTPALAVVVSVVALLSLVLQNPYGAQQSTARTGIGAMLLSANYVIGHAAGDYFAPNATTNPLLNTWSLSVEEQFYLVFPALLVLGWVLARRRRWAPILLVSAVAVGSFALSMAWSYDSAFLEPMTTYFGGAASFAFYSSLTRAWEFAVGALLALVLHRLPTLTRLRATWIGLAGIGLVAAAALWIHEGEQPFPGWIALVPVTGTLLLILAGSGSSAASNPVSTVLATRPMVAIGDISYSWYLWHWPLIVFAAVLIPNEPTVLVLAAVLSVLPSLASYAWVEQPLRRLRPRSRVRAGSLVVVTIGVPVALCTALLIGANAGWGLTAPAPAVPVQTAPVTSGSEEPTRPDGSTVPSQTPTTEAAPTEGDGEVAGGEGGSLRAEHVVVAAGCVNTPLDPVACRFGPADATGTVLLAGDSQAYALGDGVIEAAQSLGLATVATSHTGCPFLAREASGTHNYPCGSWQEEVLDWALAERPAAVVIANRSGGYVRPEKQWRTIEESDGTAASTVEAATTAYRQALEPVVRSLTKAGIPVVIVGAVPEMPGFTNQTSLLSQAFGERAFEIPRADAEADRQPAFRVEQDLAADPQVELYDPLPVICPTDTCSTVQDDQPVYQDETHLSRPGSLLLAGGLAQTLSRVVSGSAPQPR